MPTNYFIKHVKLFQSYARLSFSKWNEYKFNFVTNTLSYFVLIIVWIFFWDLLLGKVKEIGPWKFPMMLLLVGFLNINEGLWQMFWYTISLHNDIIKGKLDVYLVRPANTLYSIVMREFQVYSIFPVLMGLIIVGYTLLTYYSIEVVKIIIALTICSLGAMMIHFIFASINSIAFWAGPTRAFRSIFKAFLIAERYPIDLFSYLFRAFLTFVFPIIFFGTIPVLVITEYSLKTSFYYLGLTVLMLIVWALILYLMWVRGLKRYESQGG